MKPTILCATALLLCLSSPIYGKCQPHKENPRQKEKRERAEKRDKISRQIKKFLDSKDENNDNQVSKEEFIAGESDKEAAGKKFDAANTNGDRVLTKSEIRKMLGL